MICGARQVGALGIVWVCIEDPPTAGGTAEHRHYFVSETRAEHLGYVVRSQGG